MKPGFSITCFYIRKNDDQMIVVFSWRRDRDSNPGYLAAHTRSRRANSTTLAPLRTISLSLSYQLKCLILRKLSNLRVISVAFRV